MSDTHAYFPIGVVERDTGIGRDTLRIWERRYGFPEPVRNDKGERIYSESQLRRLQRIRRLLDQGIRPGKLLPLDEAALDTLEAGFLSAGEGPAARDIENLLEPVLVADDGQLEKRLSQQYEQLGMQQFVLERVAPLLQRVGELWASGQLQIFQEHFLSLQLTRFLCTEIDTLTVSKSGPLVLLATLPGEQHSLGLLMAAAVLAAQGRRSINLGSEVPMDQIINAAGHFRVDKVGMTFSAAYQYKNIRAHLLELRTLLPTHIEIWAGGEGAHRLRKLPAGIRRFNSLGQLSL